MYLRAQQPRRCFLRGRRSGSVPDGRELGVGRYQKLRTQPTPAPRPTLRHPSLRSILGGRPPVSEKRNGQSGKSEGTLEQRRAVTPVTKLYFSLVNPSMARTPERACLVCKCPEWSDRTGPEFEHHAIGRQGRSANGSRKDSQERRYLPAFPSLKELSVPENCARSPFTS